MVAGSWNFSIEQGSTFQKTLTFKDSDGVAINLNGYSWRMQIRKSLESSGYLLELTSAGGDIDTSSQSSGIIVINIAASTTASLDFTTAIYDLEGINGSTVTRYLSGAVSLSKEVTR